jgi:hypothetical protein
MSDIHTQALAIAGSAISVALLDFLFEAGTIDLTDARDVLDKAMRRIGPFHAAPGGVQAMQIIGDMLKTKYSARG